ncbi:MAG: ABC transporter ATP-binding protein [Tepidanaerobacteraceae bacterium]|jgi:oligopeptide/dipeptide ABC transporter ATP-binding protein|nr:ABC transporter ATP-binding protein [Thermoanaerobacterales bacterium]
MLHVRNLKTTFPTDRGIVKAVDGVDFSLKNGEIVGLVGESGCGKSMTMLSILRLVPPPGKVDSGEIIFEGKNLVNATPSEMRKIRGKKISMIFQDPMTTLNPVFKIGEQIRESMRIHGLFKHNESLFNDFFKKKQKEKEYKRVIELMEEVGIPAPDLRYNNYPHQFSGGMQQRALIAIALACEPKLLLADEPTTALDVTIQAQILELLNKINTVHKTSIILVTHDLAVAAEFCHEIAVMYAGKLVERGPVDEVMGRPKHPYTKGLLASIPKITKVKKKIKAIPGNVPDLTELGSSGCAFCDRCDVAIPKCRESHIPMIEIKPGEFVRCILYAPKEVKTVD